MNKSPRRIDGLSDRTASAVNSSHRGIWLSTPPGRARKSPTAAFRLTRWRRRVWSHLRSNTAAGWHDHEDRVGPICEQDEGSEQPTPVECAEVGDQPEDPTDDGEARLHRVASIVGRLPLGKERVIVKLKARWLLGDVDADRGPREYGASPAAAPSTKISMNRCRSSAPPQLSTAGTFLSAPDNCPGWHRLTSAPNRRDARPSLSIYTDSV